MQTNAAWLLCDGLLCGVAAGCTEETLKQVLYPLQLACASNMQVGPPDRTQSMKGHRRADKQNKAEAERSLLLTGVQNTGAIDLTVGVAAPCGLVPPFWEQPGSPAAPSSSARMLMTLGGAGPNAAGTCAAWLRGT